MPSPARHCQPVLRVSLTHNKICVAVARELAGFIWEIGRHVGPNA